MKLAVISDLHLGFAWGTERQEDSFLAARDAFQKILEEKPSAILVLGDIFDERLPKPEILAGAIDLFKEINILPKIKLTKIVKADKEELVTKEIPAILSIYGTHERRGPEHINPVQMLEKAGLLCNLHAESIAIELGNKRLGIHGLSGVPENYAKDTLRAWNPKPFPGMKNVLLMHQSFADLIPGQLTEVMRFSDLPTNFDAYLLGHIHWNVEEKHPVTSAPIIATGSTILTEMKRIESERKKGFCMLEFGTKLAIRFVPIKAVREFKYETISITNKKPLAILTELAEKASNFIKFYHGDTKPLLKFKLKGKLEEGFLPTDLSFGTIIKKFSDKILLAIDKTEVESLELSERAKQLSDLKKRASIEQIGLSLLAENLKGVDAKKIESVFNFLVEGELEKAEGDLL